MDYDESKVDEAALALMFLTTFEDGEAFRTWKTYDWEVVDRLYAKGLIANPSRKTKSLLLTAAGRERSAALFKKLFAKE